LEPGYFKKPNGGNMKLEILKLSFILSSAALLAGCSTWNKLNDTEKGAVIGGGTGVAVGNAVSPGLGGTVVGGAAGAGVGALAGHEYHENDRDRRHDDYRDDYYDRR
jgi:hypothetical protein